MHHWPASPGPPAATIGIVIDRAQQQDKGQQLLSKFGGQIVESWVNAFLRPLAGGLERRAGPQADSGQMTHASTDGSVGRANAEIRIGFTGSGFCYPAPIDY